MTGVITSLFKKRDLQPGMVETLLGGYQSASGVNVTPMSAMRSSAVFACVRVLSETVAMLPGITYRRVGRGRERATDHKLWPIFHDQANGEMTAFEWRELAMHHLLMNGNHYSEIEMNRRGEVLALWPLNPNKMDVRRTVDGSLYYHYTLPNGSYVDFPAYQIMHVRGPSPDGITGYSVIGLARQAIGLGLATEEFGSRFFSNGARPGVVLEHPGQLDPDAHTRLKQSWNESYQGLSNSQRVAILEEGMKLQTLGVPPEDAQFLETRQFQVIDISRFFRVPLHKINELKFATFSNIEHQGLEFVSDSVGPWLVRLEQAIKRDLIGPLERQSIFVEFNVAGLLRGDLSSRYNSYATARNWGWLSVNDIRALENMNEIPEGDVYLEPLNMKDANDPAPAASAKTPTEDPAAKQARDWSLIYEDAIDRIRKRASRDIEAKRAKLPAEKMAQWWAEYRSGELDAYAQLVLAPLAMTVGRDARQWAADVIRSLDSSTPRDAAGGQTVVNITNQIPTQAAPVVNVAAAEVLVPAQPAPIVNVSAAPVIVDVAAPNVTIKSPRITEENQTIERDAQGNITSTTTTVTYEGGNQ